MEQEVTTEVSAEESSAGDQARQEPKRKDTKLRRRARRRRLLRRAFRAVLWGVALVLVGTGLFYTQTARGQRIVVDTVLDRVRGRLAGELGVEGIRSRSLLFGVTLQHVQLDAEGERRFLEADSVVLRYSPVSLAIGTPRIGSATFYGLQVEISQRADEDFINVEKLLAPSDGGPSGPGTPTTVGLGRIAVRGGVIEILTPAEDAPVELTVASPSGERLRRIAFEDLDLDLEQTVFRTGGAVTLDARLASLSTSIFLLEHPLVIREAIGALTFGDRGLRVDGGQLRLPGSFIEGDLGFGPDRPGDPWLLAADLSVEDWGDLADIGWIDPRIPAGRFRGAASLRLEDGVQITLRDADVESTGSTLALAGAVRFSDQMSMRSLRLTANPLDLALVKPWLESDLPFDGVASGNATLSGTLRDLAMTGRMTFVPDALSDAVTTADFGGTLHTGSNPGGTELDVRLDPFDYRVLEPLWTGASALGTGRAMVTVSGRADDGLLVVADLTHRSDATNSSRAVGRGTARRDVGGDWVVDVRGELAPLSLPLLGRLWPEVDLPGVVRGPVRARGYWTDLRIDADLTANEGRLVFGVRTDMTSPAERYLIEAEADELELSAFTSSVPSPSVVTGRVSLDGTGIEPDSLTGSATIEILSAVVGALAVDSTSAVVEMDRGLLTAREVHAQVSGIAVDGGGSIGMNATRTGSARFSFSAETLEGLRPAFMGDSILVADTLTPLEGDALRARGIDPDTLPTALDVRLEGALEGTADVRGWLGDLDLALIFDLEHGAYGHNSVDTATVSLVASGLPQTMGNWDIDLSARRLTVSARDFDEVRFDGAMLQRAGEGILDVVRRPGESYHLTGAFAVDSLGGEVQLTEAEIRVDSMSWELLRPTEVAWDGRSLRVDSLEIRRVGDDPMLLRAAGTLTRGGDSDFDLLVEGFHIEHALGLAQREDIDLAGHVDIELEVTGPAEAPVILADVEMVEPRYGPVTLSRAEGTLRYEGRLAAVDLTGWVDDRRVFTGEGVVPVDLALTEIESRAVEDEMDLTLRADSLDAALALVYLTALEDVVGTVSAEMLVEGTPNRPQPSGTVTLSQAGWTVSAIGVRHTNVSGELLLQPDGTVGVKLASAGGPESGTSTISGLVQLDPLSDPTLDLDVSFGQFLAVDRRDMYGRISGDLTVTGRYRLPVAQGTVRMDEGTLYVEEFARNAGVVDLRSPLLYAPTIAVDTTVFVSQPLIADLSNPFLDNLRVGVELAVPRNLWLRSPEMDVELGGDLIVRYDRAEGDLVLLGELQALRGSYSVLERTFVVDGGAASFLGQPGVNPSLDIQALSRVRRREGDPLEVRATVGGTLVEPVITLSTEEAGISQSDLITYLLIGRSAAEVGPQAEVLRSGVGTLLTSAVVSELGSTLAQQLPLVNQLDYLSFSSSAAIGQDDVQGSAFGTALGNTQVELGKYLNDRVFVIFVLGGTEGDQESGASLQLRGVRLELELADSFFLEGFMEDRFLRTGTAFGSTDLDGSEILGFFLFGEWGFGSEEQD